MPSNTRNKGSKHPQGSTIVDKAYSRPLQVLRQIGQESAPILPPFEEVGGIQMDERMQESLSRLKEISGKTPNTK